MSAPIYARRPDGEHVLVGHGEVEDLDGSAVVRFDSTAAGVRLGD